SVAVELKGVRPPGELWLAGQIITFNAMADHPGLRANPQAMQGVSQAVSGAAKDLQHRLIELDGQVRDMLAGWQGGAGGAYGQAWDLWHRGADEVHLGLAILAKAVGVVGVDFQTQESASTQQLRGVDRD